MIMVVLFDVDGKPVGRSQLKEGSKKPLIVNYDGRSFLYYDENIAGAQYREVTNRDVLRRGGRADFSGLGGPMIMMVLFDVDGKPVGRSQLKEGSKKPLIVIYDGRSFLYYDENISGAQYREVTSATVPVHELRRAPGLGPNV